MALTQVTGPYPIFTDLDGTPLDDGYLYIGAINQDPEQNPIQVFWDSNLTIPATQPIRTSNGYAYRNGTPALLYTAGEFSITIRNKREEFVLYSPVGYGFDPAAVSASVVKNDFVGDGVEVDFTLSSAPSTILATNVFINGVYQEKDSYSLSGNVITFSIAPPLSSSIEIMTNETGIINAGNATAISYTLTAPGAVQQTVQTKLEQYVSVKDFGAVGDGVTDDTAAFDAAIAYAHSIDGATIFVPAGIYGVTDLVLNYPNIIIEGSTSQYAYEGSYGAASTLKALPGSKFALVLGIGTTFAGNYSGLRNLVVDGNGAVEFGVCIGIGNTVMDSCTITGFEYGCVLASFGNSNIFERCAFYSNSKIGFASVDTFDDPVVEAATPGTAPFVNGFTTTYTVRNCNIRQNGYGVFLQNSWAARFEDCVIESNTRAGLWIYKAVPAVGTDNKFNKHGTFSSVWFENNWAGYVSGQQYSNVGWKYVENVPSAVYDDTADAGYTINICGFNSSNHPEYFTFNECIVATSAPQKCLWAAQGQFIKFYRTQLWGDFDLQTFAENYTFEECDFNSVGQIPSILAGGTDSWVVRLDEANTTKALSDYDADSFTPLVVGTTVNGAATYTRQRAFYQRFGSLVNFTVDLAWSAHTGSGNMEIIDLPFLAKNTGGANWTVSIMANGLALTAGYVPVAQIVDNTTAIKLVQTPTGGGTLISIPLDTSVSELVISGTYYTS